MEAMIDEAFIRKVGYVMVYTTHHRNIIIARIHGWLFDYTNIKFQVHIKLRRALRSKCNIAALDDYLLRAANPAITDRPAITDSIIQDQNTSGKY